MLQAADQQRESSEYAFIEPNGFSAAAPTLVE
jgi:hypothetical protein